MLSKVYQKDQEKDPRQAGVLFLVALLHSDWNVLLEELSRWKLVYRGGVSSIYPASSD